MATQAPLRHTITVTIIVTYLLPILFFAGYATTLMSPDKSWNLLMGGLILAMVGSSFLILKLWKWEQKTWAEMDALGLQPKIASHATAAMQEHADLYEEENPIEAVDQKGPSETQLKLEAAEERVQALEEELEEKMEALQVEIEERQSLEQQIEQLRQEFSFYQESSREQLNQKDEKLVEYTETISELRRNMENKQQKISKLQSSVDDLTYEVRTILNISEQADNKRPAPTKSKKGKFVQTSLFNSVEKEIEEDAPFEEGEVELAHVKEQLNRCLNTAQKITGASHFEVTSQMGPLDQRRLFDSLQSESEELVVVYAPREDKILFANQHGKELLGYSGERLVHDFFSLMQEGIHAWKEAVQSLKEHQSNQTEVVFTARSGEAVRVRCELGLIPSGLFKGYVVGVLHEASRSASSLLP